MAISATHYRLLKSLPLPRGGSLLEIGEANWYGDIPVPFASPTSESMFDVAKEVYFDSFQVGRIVSVDFNGTPAALKQDLNAPLDLAGEQFDVVMNHGTAEHIFNIGQVFKTIHDHTIDGGWMIHESPFTGWIDHGFYCLQPTLFYDLAAANCYEIVLVAIEHIESQTIIRLESRDRVGRLAEAGEIPNNSMLYVALRKYGERPFRVPMQGYYNRTLSPAGVRAWERNR